MSFQQRSNVLSAQSVISMLQNFTKQYEGKMDVKLSHHADVIEDLAQARAVRRTGEMANKTTKRKYSGKNGKGYEVRGDAGHTIYVHQGTSRMPARPYLKEAFDQEKKNVLKVTAKDIGLTGGSGFGSGW